MTSTAPFEGVPTLGLVEAPSPVTEVPDIARRLGLDWLGFKRDDHLTGLYGGSKVRKLDVLLAAEPWASAPGWVSAGAIGSGHLVAVAAAARHFERELFALHFWEPPSERVLENLAFVAGTATRFGYRHSRTGLALRYPQLLTGGSVGGWTQIPPGAACPAGTLGAVMAGLELADQVDRGVLPPPDRVYVALGTGGMATGLSIGLQLGGVGAEVIAVATVERLLTGSWRLRRHADAVRAALSAHSIAAPAPALTVVRDQLGGGYGRPTGTGEAAKALAGAAGIGLESIYTAKAMAALLADVGRGGRALMWVTCRREAPLPTASGWTRRLPGALRRRLDRSPGSWRRRRLLIGGAAATVVVGARVTGYDAWDGAGHVLADWEAHVLHACARALLPPAPDDGLFSEIPKRVDRYVQSMPPRGRLELHAALATIEHGTTPLTLRWSRVTACDSDEVRDYLETLARRGGLQRQLYRAARDLCMLGYYQQPATWPEMGYDGPLARPTTLPAHYTGLRAPEGAAPPGWTPV